MGVLSRPPPRRCGGAGRRAQLLQQRAARRVPLLLALSALIVTATAASAQQQQQPKQAPPPKELHIAHVNDVHNRIEETSPAGSYCDAKQRAKGVCVGGWARIGAAVGTARRQAAREGAGFLFLDAGDEFDGSLWDVVYKGLATADVQNAVMPDAMVRAGAGGGGGFEGVKGARWRGVEPARCEKCAAQRQPPLPTAVCGLFASPLIPIPSTRSLPPPPPPTTRSDRRSATTSFRSRRRTSGPTSTASSSRCSARGEASCWGGAAPVSACPIAACLPLPASLAGCAAASNELWQSTTPVRPRPDAAGLMHAPQNTTHHRQRQTQQRQHDRPAADRRQNPPLGGQRPRRRRQSRHPRLADPRDRLFGRQRRRRRLCARRACSPALRGGSEARAPRSRTDHRTVARRLRARSQDSGGGARSGPHHRRCGLRCAALRCAVLCCGRAGSQARRARHLLCLAQSLSP